MLFFYFKIIYLLLYSAKLVFPLNMCKETGENPFGKTDRRNNSIKQFNSRILQKRSKLLCQLGNNK